MAWSNNASGLDDRPPRGPSRPWASGKLNLVKPGDKNEWRSQGVVDLTQPSRQPTVIQPPANPEYMRPSTTFGGPSHRNGDFVDLTGGTRSLPFGNYRDDDGAPDLEPIDAEKAFKDLLNGLNSPTIPKRRTKRKNKKSKESKIEKDEDVFASKSPEVEDEELASLLKGTKLDDPTSPNNLKAPKPENDGSNDEESEEPEEGEDDDEGEEEDLAHVEGLKVRLLPHQVDGVQFLLSREEGKKRGGILADDVSLILCSWNSELTFIDGPRENGTVACADSLTSSSSVPNRVWGYIFVSLAGVQEACIEAQHGFAGNTHYRPIIVD